MSDPERDVVSAREAAEALALPVASVERRVRAGLLRGYTEASGAVFVYRDGIEATIRNRELLAELASAPLPGAEPLGSEREQKEHEGPSQLWRKLHPEQQRDSYAGVAGDAYGRSPEEIRGYIEAERASWDAADGAGSLWELVFVRVPVYPDLTSVAELHRGTDPGEALRWFDAHSGSDAFPDTILVVRRLGYGFRRAFADQRAARAFLVALVEARRAAGIPEGETEEPEPTAREDRSFTFIRLPVITTDTTAELAYFVGQADAAREALRWYDGHGYAEDLVDMLLVVQAIGCRRVYSGPEEIRAILRAMSNRGTV